MVVQYPVCTLAAKDFYLWGYIQEEVYKDVVENLFQTEQKIVQEFEKLKSGNALEFVYASLIRRAELCMRQGGNIFNHIWRTIKKNG